ncbi:MAG: mitochondrial inner membrane protease ATP23 [Nanoarchaeota archaeon]|nr:mitochondrial inner membrane protease ATP23 [Nanoarchaeota archaeon]MBU2443805.1 mitochondrial inner membrane protease ATP23 [Nanoarchaeota archaeon]
MLKIMDVIWMYEEGMTAKVISRLKNPDQKGEYRPDKDEIVIAADNIKSEDDFNITLVHELIHARNDLLYSKKELENEVEKEALKTYNLNPGVALFARQIYKIDYNGKN